MAIDRSKKLLTYEDYAKLPDDGKLYELIDGDLVVSPAPTILHQRLLLELVFEIRLFLGSHPVGEVLVAPLDVVLDPHQVLHPDILFVSAGRTSLFTKTNLPAAPDLAVEILSPGTKRRDLGRKRGLYDQYGVREYWILHQDAPRIDVLRRGPGGKLVRVERMGEADRLETPLLPGFGLHVGDLYLRAKAGCSSSRPTGRFSDH